MVEPTNELMNIDDLQNVEGGKCKKKASKELYVILKLGKKIVSIEEEVILNLTTNVGFF
jgi:hypothetical protein